MVLGLVYIGWRLRVLRIVSTTTETRESEELWRLFRAAPGRGHMRDVAKPNCGCEVLKTLRWALHCP